MCNTVQGIVQYTMSTFKHRRYSLCHHMFSHKVEHIWYEFGYQGTAS